MVKTNWRGYEKYVRLASAFGPPGMEGPVCQEMIQLLEPYVKSLEIDKIGNLYGETGAETATTVVLSAHMDEIALIVNEINDEGGIGVIPQGFLQPANYHLQEVVVLGAEGPVLGITVVNLHKGNQFTDVMIDVGANSASEVRSFGIQLGDRVCFNSKTRFLGTDKIIGKAADDRTGLYVLAEVARRIEGKDLPIRLVFLCTTQEEGVDTFAAWAGARVAARRLSPSLFIGIDTIGACDLLGANTAHRKSTISLSGGIAILRGAQDLHIGLVDYLLESAQSLDLNHQIMPIASTATDLTVVSRAYEGVPCAGLALPIRYAHTANEIFHWKTLEDAVELILNILQQPEKLLQITKQAY